MPALEAWMAGRKVGILAREEGVFSFAYDSQWLAGPASPLTQSMPAREEPYEGPLVQAFFSNLLPEGATRDLVARRVGVSAGNDFALLEAIGGDCAGAISLLPEGGGTDAGRATQKVKWLDERQLAAALDELPSRPLLAASNDDVRLSLAGAQDKLPVVMDGERIGIPEGQTPSTHIIKTPIDRLEDTVANEAFCLALAGRLGLAAAQAEVRAADGRPFLLVERYDRERRDGETVRVHQEDFCQALGFGPSDKYENEGGPGIEQCFDLVRAAATFPAPNVLALVDAAALNFCIGNHDAHAKNFSLVYREEVSLAPLYDLVCTAAYPGLSRKMAMKLGGEYRAERVMRRHIERFAQAGGLGAAAVARRFAALAGRVVAVAEGLRAEARAEGWDAPALDRVVEVISERSQHLAREAGASGRA